MRYYGGKTSAEQGSVGGGQLSGKLPPGEYRGQALAVSREANRVLLIVQTVPTKQCHAEELTDLPMGIAHGTELRLVVRACDGYVCARIGGRYRARDVETNEWLTELRDDMGEIYHELAAKGRYPASTEIALLEYKMDDGWHQWSK